MVTAFARFSEKEEQTQRVYRNVRRHNEPFRNQLANL